MAEVGIGLAEDEAIKAKVSGLTLPNTKRGAPDAEVPVRFRYPEAEFNPGSEAPSPAGIQYPLITIDFLSITYDRTRDHVNNVPISYVPDMAPELPDPTKEGITEYPLPVLINYSITGWSVSARHNSLLRASLLAPSRLPLRFGYLYVPADETLRQMFSLGVRQDHFIERVNNRRIFRSIFSMNVEAELLKTDIVQGVPVEEIILDPPTHVPPHMHGVH